MINRVVTGISTVILGGLIACVPNFILTICPYCQGMAMRCSWAAKAEFGVGVLIVFLGILLAFVESGDTRMGISTALGFVGILAAMVVKVLIGLCDGSCSPDCSCSTLTAPLLMTLGIITAALSFINAFYLSRAKNT